METKVLTGICFQPTEKINIYRSQQETVKLPHWSSLYLTLSGSNPLSLGEIYSPAGSSFSTTKLLGEQFPSLGRPILFCSRSSILGHEWPSLSYQIHPSPIRLAECLRNSGLLQTLDEVSKVSLRPTDCLTFSLRPSIMTPPLTC